MKNLNEMKKLKIYDPEPEKTFTKAKVARLKQEHTDLNVSGDIETCATNHIDIFPTADSASMKKLRMPLLRMLRH